MPLHCGNAHRLDVGFSLVRGVKVTAARQPKKMTRPDGEIWASVLIFNRLIREKRPRQRTVFICSCPAMSAKIRAAIVG
jgi:hypothetical protein